MAFGLLSLLGFGRLGFPRSGSGVLPSLPEGQGYLAWDDSNGKELILSWDGPDGKQLLLTWDTTPPEPEGGGTMDFSSPDNSGLLVLLEDV